MRVVAWPSSLALDPSLQYTQMYFASVTQNPVLAYPVGIAGAVPRTCINFISQGHSGQEGCGGRLLIREMLRLLVQEQALSDLILSFPGCLQCQPKLLLSLPLLEVILHGSKCFSMEAMKTGTRWGRRDWAVVIINNAELSRKEQGWLCVAFLMGKVLGSNFCSCPPCYCCYSAGISATCSSKLFAICQCIVRDGFVSWLCSMTALAWLDAA